MAIKQTTCIHSQLPNVCVLIINVNELHYRYIAYNIHLIIITKITIPRFQNIYTDFVSWKVYEISLVLVIL